MLSCTRTQQQHTLDIPPRRQQHHRLSHPHPCHTTVMTRVTLQRSCVPTTCAECMSALVTSWVTSTRSISDHCYRVMQRQHLVSQPVYTAPNTSDGSHNIDVPCDISHQPNDRQHTLTPLIPVTTMSAALTEQLMSDAEANAEADADYQPHQDGPVI